MTTISGDFPPLPPFTRETATETVRAAEDAWNTRDPERVAQAYSVDSLWRNRAEFLSGRPAIVQFLRRKRVRELDYRLAWLHATPVSEHQRLAYPRNGSEVPLAPGAESRATLRLSSPGGQIVVCSRRSPRPRPAPWRSRSGWRH